MKFRDEFYFLSNMYPIEIAIAGYKFTCAEAAFQAAKCISPEDKHRFEGLDGFEAKQLGKRVKLRPDWNKVRIPLMKRILKVKFSNPDLLRQLASIREDIVEENTWNDKFWGVCRGEGRNELGKLLMEIRSEAWRKTSRPPKFKMQMVKGDLFTSDAEVLVHCVSADFALGAGIAKQFRDRFNMKNKLKAELPDALKEWDRGNHGFCVVVDNVANLVTKRTAWDKPTYETLRKALHHMSAMICISGIRSIAMPLIGCGLDRLEWNKVKSVIEDVFRDWDGTITVYTLK